MARITTSSTGGNVNIQDTNGKPLTSTAGSLNVNVTNDLPNGVSVIIYNEITGVAMGASQTIATYTVPTGKTLVLQRVDSSADSVAIIEVELNSVVNAKRRIYYTSFNTEFDFSSGFLVPAGTVINIVATNNSSMGAATFNATILGVLQ